MRILYIACILPLFLTSCSTPQLSPWHTVSLSTEFTASQGREFESLDDYIKLEDDLFEELSTKLHTETPYDQNDGLRFTRGSPKDPLTHRPNWNRTFEFKPSGETLGGVLMLHSVKPKHIPLGKCSCRNKIGFIAPRISCR